MANIASNPWSFANGDVATQTITSVTLNADGTVTLVGTGALGTAIVQDSFVTVISVTDSTYNGFYKVIAKTAADTIIMQPIRATAIPAGTAASGTGTVAHNAYDSYIRIEDISWQNASAAGQTLDLRDRNGNIIWQATATGAGSQNRGKLFWVNGLTVIKIDSGVALLTIN